MTEFYDHVNDLEALLLHWQLARSRRLGIGTADVVLSEASGTQSSQDNRERS